jgi:hypothetical protein
MTKLFRAVTTIVFSITLGGCLASTSSPDGVNCDFSKEKPIWEMPPDCVGGR